MILPELCTDIITKISAWTSREKSIEISARKQPKPQFISLGNKKRNLS